MDNKRSLEGSTLYVTGTTKVQTIAKIVEEHGGEVAYFPLITTRVHEGEDRYYLERLPSYEWLIFTSQNAVQYFMEKLEGLPKPTHIKVAAVGEKTKKALQQYGLQVDFMPSTYSADCFVREFPAQSIGKDALFIRGKLAKSTIRDALHCDEWTVYETCPLLTYVDAFIASLRKAKRPIVVFASPSAVDVYARYIVPAVDWCDVTIASIGHITTASLTDYGAHVAIQPTTYTMQAVVEQLIGGF